MNKNKLSLGDLVKEKIVIMDGATGTEIQALQPTVDDFGGPELDGCNDILSLRRPDFIKAIHEKYIKAGAEGIKTNTFGASGVVLSKYNIQDQSYLLNKRSAELAREVADSFKEKIFVLGSMGPGTKLPSLGHITYDALFSGYSKQAEGLLDGGVDVFIIETCYDILQCKTAVQAVLAAMNKKSRKLPIMVQVTIEATGQMLVGTDIQAALTTVSAFDIFSFGLNCSLGPDEMRPSYAYLAENCPLAISCMPNAGIPQDIKGKSTFPLPAKMFAEKIKILLEDSRINIIGGCCGTGPDHIRELSALLSHRKPNFRPVVVENAVSSLYSAVTLRQEPRPLIIGERTNANGSKLFRESLGRNDFDAMVDIAKNEAKEGAHLIDCCVAFVGRNETDDIRAFLEKVTKNVNIPLMIDSTDPRVVEEALKIIPGKSIVNSINFEDGEEKARQILSLCKIYGAAVVGLTIDETGMAKTADQKLKIAERLYRLAVEEFGLNPGDLIIDPLTFTLASGEESLKNSAQETLQAIRSIKLRFPDIKTNLGVSNISYGLKPAIRSLLNSVFLYHAVKAGLDLAICNKQKIIPIYKIDQADLALFEDLIFNRSSDDGRDPLKVILSRFTSGATNAVREQDHSSHLPPEEELPLCIVDGNKKPLAKLLNDLLKRHSATDILNNYLLNGMRMVGEKFSSGEMQLPFVLESAEAMSTAVKMLETHLQGQKSAQKRLRILLATVKGDVHDIGKNLVNIIFTNNGYEVIDLGIKQPIESIIAKIKELNPDVLGLSGLLVKSTQVMRSDLQELSANQIKIPVLLGGAALNKRYVTDECQPVYGGMVFYAKDAFQGLDILKTLKIKKG